MTEGPENGGGEGTRSNDPDRGPATWRDKATGAKSSLNNIMF